MDYKINVNFDRFEEQLKVVDAHTMGEFCRILEAVSRNRKATR